MRQNAVQFSSGFTVAFIISASSVTWLPRAATAAVRTELPGHKPPLGQTPSTDKVGKSPSRFTTEPPLGYDHHPNRGLDLSVCHFPAHFRRTTITDGVWFESFLHRYTTISLESTTS